MNSNMLFEVAASIKDEGDDEHVIRCLIGSAACILCERGNGIAANMGCDTGRDDDPAEVAKLLHQFANRIEVACNPK